MTHLRASHAPLLSLLVVLTVLFCQPAWAQNENLLSGAVYVQTDNPLGNQIIAFYRHNDGTVREAGRFNTGGFGTQFHNISGGSVSVAKVGNNQFLFVCNLGSNDLSVFEIETDHLELRSLTQTGTVRPDSVTIFEHLVYVVGEVSGTLNGFTVDGKGQLTPIPGSTRIVTGGGASEPFQVLFNRDGSILAVSDENTNLVDTFVVDRTTGLTRGPIPNNAFGINPFGMFFDKFGHLFVTAGGFDAPGASTMSSFQVNADGTLTVISALVNDFQQFECWVQVTNPDLSTGIEYGFVDNTGNSSVSSYQIHNDGTMTLANPVAATATNFPLIGIVDNGISSDSHFYYAATEGPLGALNAYAIQNDGSLVPIQQINGLPLGTSGMAVM